MFWVFVDDMCVNVEFIHVELYVCDFWVIVFVLSLMYSGGLNLGDGVWLECMY